MDKTMKEIYQTICDLGLEESSNDRAIEKMVNAILFKKYIESKGFNPERYGQLLELNQDVLGSVSRLLKNYQQFLLSTKVDYSELQFTGIHGAKGFVEKDGIFVPKSLEADDYFFGGYLPKVPYKRHWYAYPKIGENFCEYDVTISNGISKEDHFDLIFHSDMDLFLGDMLDISDKNYEINKRKLLMKLDQIRDNSIGLNISVDSDHSTGKEYVLLSRRK